MNIITIHDQYIPDPIGLNNFGNTCYLNSLIQCLLSCSSFNEIIINEINNNSNSSNSNNKLLIAYRNLIINLLNKTNKTNNLNITPQYIYEGLILGARKRKDIVKFEPSLQQDAQEGFLLFMDILNIPKLNRLFNYRYHIKMKCELCNKWCLDKYEENIIMTINPEFETDKNIRNINDFLIKHEDDIDNNHICDLCKRKSSKKKITTLVMIPEILCISVNKYIRKYNTNLPNQLEFLYKTKEKKLIYKLVAQSEHYGSQGGGHYNAIVLRKNNAYLCDDLSINNTKLGTTLNTYICFYHYYKSVDI
jgi:ubiquitin C-terminal hydrolase